MKKLWIATILSAALVTPALAQTADWSYDWCYYHLYHQDCLHYYYGPSIYHPDRDHGWFRRDHDDKHEERR